jgi:hypothetical protein
MKDCPNKFYWPMAATAIPVFSVAAAQIRLAAFQLY